MCKYRVQYGRTKSEILSESELISRFHEKLCRELVSSDFVIRTVIDQGDGKIIITRVASNE